MHITRRWWKCHVHHKIWATTTQKVSLWNRFPAFHHIGGHGAARLVVPNAVEKDMFQLVHDANAKLKTIDRFTSFPWFIFLLLSIYYLYQINLTRRQDTDQKQSMSSLNYCSRSKLYLLHHFNQSLCYIRTTANIFLRLTYSFSTTRLLPISKYPLANGDETLLATLPARDWSRQVLQRDCSDQVIIRFRPFPSARTVILCPRHLQNWP